MKIQRLLIALTVANIALLTLFSCSIGFGGAQDNTQVLRGRRLKSWMSVEKSAQASL